MLAREVSSAYKANPILGALLILNLTTLGGFGWYLWDKESRVAKYVLTLHADTKELRNKLIELSYECSQHRRRERR